MRAERWLPVRGWRSLYEVSDLGRVRNVLTGTVLAPTMQGNYLTVQLSCGSYQNRMRVHRLVGEAFLGPLPAGMETRHGLGGRLDNRLVNLAYGTAAENNADQDRDGTRRRGADRLGAKLTAAAVAECRRRVAAGETRAAIARELGVHPSRISRVVAGSAYRLNGDSAPLVRRDVRSRWGMLGDAGGCFSRSGR